MTNRGRLPIIEHMFDKLAQLQRLEKARRVLANRPRPVKPLASAYQQVAGGAGLLEMAAEKMGESGWAVFLDFPDLGWQRAWQIGLDLRRVISIPYTGGSAAYSPFWRVENCSIPYTGGSALACAQLFVPCAAVLAIGMVDYGPQQQRILTAKARRSGCVILSAPAWAGAISLAASARHSTSSPGAVSVIKASA